MSLFGSLFGSSSKQNATTNSTTNFTGNSVGTAPDWLTEAMKGITGNITTLGSHDPLSYVAGANPLQTQAGTIAGGLSGSPWNFDGAADLTRGVAAAAAPHTSGVQALPYVQQYMDSGLDNYVKSTLADFDFNAGKTRAADDLSLAGSGAFGGSGAALTKSATADALARARASTDAGLRSSAYTQALTAAGADATRQQGAKDLNAQLQAQGQDRTLAAARQLGDLSTTYDANQRANVGAQGAIGDMLRAITQQQAQAPLDLAKFTATSLPDLLRGLFGQNTSGTSNTVGTQTGKTGQDPSVASDIGDIAAIASLFMSDRRLKTDIVRLGTRPDGLGVYLYRYLWSPARFIGVMAQEVLKVKPEAVVTLPSGFMAVNYGAL
jgi:hypothetical protein